MIAQNVAEILTRHVRLTVEGIDRMYLNLYVPRLQTERGIVWLFREHRGHPLLGKLRPSGRGHARTPRAAVWLCHA